MGGSKLAEGSRVVKGSLSSRRRRSRSSGTVSGHRGFILLLMTRDPSPEQNLYFFPDAEVTLSELEKILTGDDRGRKAWAISHLLRYAQWDDIWTHVSREEVREIFSELDLPETLARAWARMLKIEATVG
jgi:hypothetical protein